MSGRTSLIPLLALCLILPACGAVGRTKLRQAVKPAVPHSQFDVAYAEVDGKKLKLEAFWPEGPGPFPLIVNIPGGAWYKSNVAFAKRFGDPP